MQTLAYIDRFSNNEKRLQTCPNNMLDPPGTLNVTTLISEFAVTDAGYLMASRIQHLLCESLRVSIENEQQDDTFLPRIMTYLETDLLDYLKLRTSVKEHIFDIMLEILQDIKNGGLTREQCQKWMKKVIVIK